MLFRKVRAAIIEKGYKHSDVARILGISTVAFSKKMNGRAPFTLGEVEVASKFLEVTSDIFFGEKVHLKKTSKPA